MAMCYRLVAICAPPHPRNFAPLHRQVCFSKWISHTTLIVLPIHPKLLVICKQCVSASWRKHKTRKQIVWYEGLCATFWYSPTCLYHVSHPHCTIWMSGQDSPHSGASFSELQFSFEDGSNLCTKSDIWNIDSLNVFWAQQTTQSLKTKRTPQRMHAQLCKLCLFLYWCICDCPKLIRPDRGIQNTIIRNTAVLRITINRLHQAFTVMCCNMRSSCMDRLF